jgi:hypothetical protein
MGPITHKRTEPNLATGEKQKNRFFSKLPSILTRNKNLCSKYGDLHFFSWKFGDFWPFVSQMNLWTVHCPAFFLVSNWLKFTTQKKSLAHFAEFGQISTFLI